MAFAEEKFFICKIAIESGKLVHIETDIFSNNEKSVSIKAHLKKERERWLFIVSIIYLPLKSLLGSRQTLVVV